MKSLIVSIVVLLVIAASIPAAVRIVGSMGMDAHDHASDVIIIEHTALPHRFLDLEGTRNTRDIGGYPAGGGVIPWGMFYRSDNLHSLTEDDLARLAALGVNTIIDLREQGRIEKYPNRIPSSASYRILPIYDDTKPLHIPLLLNRKEIPQMFQDSYIEYLDQWAHRIQPVFELLADADSYPLIIHCTNGKDRVGVITALLLDLLGTEHSVIISDFSLSNLPLQAATDHFIEHEEGKLLLRIGIPRDDLTELMGVRSSWMQYFLAYLYDTYGSAQSYLTGYAGVSEETIALIRNILIDQSAREPGRMN